MQIIIIAPNESATLQDLLEQTQRFSSSLTVDHPL